MLYELKWTGARTAVFADRAGEGRANKGAWLSGSHKANNLNNLNNLPSGP